MNLNKIYNMPCEEGLLQIGDKSIDLTVTSPPYDNLRDYNGYSFDFETIAKQLFRVTKDGGVVVWVVGDATINGSETGTSFKQALYFKECGFNLHDTMIYNRAGRFPQSNRYWSDFEYMFVFCKGKIKTFNPLKIKKSISTMQRHKSKTYTNTIRLKSGEIVRGDDNQIKRLNKRRFEQFRNLSNVWYIPAGYGVGTKEKYAHEHPAIYPEKLAGDHIKSWSNEGDLILDPFMGSGTTAKCCLKLKRNYIGFEISEKYCKLIEKRIKLNKDLFTI